MVDTVGEAVLFSTPLLLTIVGYILREYDLYAPKWGETVDRLCLAIAAVISAAAWLNYFRVMPIK